MACAIALCLAVFSIDTAQAQWQDLAALRTTAETYVHNQLRAAPGKVHVTAAHPESRLRLPECAKLMAFAPAGTRWWGPASVGIRCQAPSIWSVYLPVSVRILSEVVVAARGIQKGQLITHSDVSLRESDITQLAHAGVLDIEQVVGRTAKANIGGGMLVRSDLLQAPSLIHQGESVRLAYAGDGFEVVSSGRALSTAGLGESVDVRAGSGRLLKGVVRGKGSVWVR